MILQSSGPMSLIAEGPAGWQHQHVPPRPNHPDEEIFTIKTTTKLPPIPEEQTTTIEEEHNNHHGSTNIK